MKYQQWMVVGLLFFALLTVSCISKAPTHTEDTSKNELAQVTEQIEADSDDNNISFEREESDVKVNLNTGKNMEWPTDIPSFVPRLDGDIISIVEAKEGSIIGYSMAFEKIKNTNITLLANQLENIYGWTILTKSALEDGWTINAMHEEKSAFFLATIHDGDAGTLHITFNK